MNAVVKLDRVGKSYTGGVTALRDVSLAVGYGKSTMLHLIGTLDRPSTGAVWIDGHDVVALSDR